jgi:hypothetical protein
MDYAEEERKEYPTQGRQSRLPLSEQEKCISELHDIVRQLEVVLKPVLTPIPDSDPSTVEERAESVTSPIATQMGANNYGLRKANKTLARIIERVEC